MPFLALSGKLYGQDTAYTFPDGLRNFVYPELIVRGYNKIKDVKDMHKAKHNMSARVNLILLQETMKFLSRTGGVESWQKIFKKR